MARRDPQTLYKPGNFYKRQLGKSSGLGRARGVVDVSILTHFVGVCYITQRETKNPSPFMDLGVLRDFAAPTQHHREPAL